MKNLKRLSITIVTHVYATGPSFKLEDYLKNKVASLIFIGHPFSFSSDTRSFVRVYKKGKLVHSEKFIYWRGPDPLFYLKDMLLTLFWSFKYGKRQDYFIGVNNFNVFSGYLLKIFGKVEKIIFYTIDYIPQRFVNNFLNSIYHFLDDLAVKKSHKVWNLSGVMVTEREKRGISEKYKNKQIVVPIGTDMGKKILSYKNIDRYKIVFMGHLREGQGVEMLINAMTDVVKKVPSAHLLIVGGGNLENSLRNQVNKLKLSDKIEFSGFVKDFSTVQALLRDSAIAVAPYVDDEKTYTRYTDPGKPKDYLSCGIPVIITKVPQVAYEIEKNKCGIAIEYNKKALVEAIVRLLKDDRLLFQYRRNATIMAKEYSWNSIFNRALKNTI